MVEEFEDGAWLVELAPLSDPELVPRAVASVLGIREAPGTTLLDSLVAHLEARESLLVLDNCEHLVETCAEMVATLLGSCPNLRILATSREALRVPGEMLFAVPSLSARPATPARGRGPDRLRGSPSVRRAGKGGKARLRAH